MKHLFLDFETYNTVDIKVGTHKYAETAEAMLLAWAYGNDPVAVIDLTNGETMPYELLNYLADPDVIVVAHNAPFDRTIMRVVLGHDLPPERWHCTMAQALAHSLPAGLSALCEVFKLPVDKAKDKEARKLMLKFSKPGPKGKRFTRDTHPMEWLRFIEYARQDVVAMRAVMAKMPKRNYMGFERQSWELDQRINDRGMHVDLFLAHGAVTAVEAAQARLKAEVDEMTYGVVGSATEVQALREHLADVYGVDAPDLTKATVAELLEGYLPSGARALLLARQQAGTSSTAKYKSLLKAVSWDGRLRGTKQWCGASRTGRWSGRLFQPDNLPRPDMEDDEIAAGVAAFKGGYAELIEPNVLHLASNTIRACIAAPHGRKLAVADLSNIEGRVAAWLCGEEWKLQAFRDYDAGTGPDLYKLAFAKAFNIRPEDVTKDQRQVGKVMELAMQYEGGVGAFVTFALAYGIDLDAMAEGAWPMMPAELQAQARIMLQWHRKRGRTPPEDNDMSEDTWLACEGLKLGWRANHPAISGFWRQLGNAFIHCCLVENDTVDLGLVQVRREKAWMIVTMPSGRRLYYPSPAYRGEEETCEMCDGEGVFEEHTCPTCDGAGVTMGSARMTFWGVDLANRWSKQHTYGGKLFENLVQAVARDVLAWAMPGIERAGYPIVLTVHDEVVTEVPDSPAYNAENLARLLSVHHIWSDGLPLAAAGFESPFYKK